MDILTMKQLTRADALSAREAMPREKRQAKSSAICGQLAALLSEAENTFAAPITVAVYSAMKSEVELYDFIDRAYASGARVVFPCMNRTRIDGLRMSMRAVGQAAYESGSVPFVGSPIEAFEIDEDVVVGFDLVQPEEIDMIVVPMVAFDATGARLGYGGGNYDTFLPRLRRDALVVGAAFEEQRVAIVPTEAHDLPLPHIASA